MTAPVLKTERTLEWLQPETEHDEADWILVYWPGCETADDEEMLSHVPAGHEYRITTEVTRAENVIHGRKPE